MHTVPVAIVLAMAISGAAEAATIRVPADAPSIQQAINAAAPGDVVVVAPGVYNERITFLGKAIVVESEQGPAATVIDGTRGGSVVTFTAGETRGAVLRGFTIQNGATTFSGGGILIQNSSPSILDNWIVGNGGCSGAGVYSSFGSPLIRGNRIARNFVFGCSGASGLGVYIGGNSAAELIGNVITDNNGPANGGGVTLFAAGAVSVRSNLIARNVTSGFSPCTSGGGIWMVNFSQATIVDNLIVGNVAGCGGGFYWGGSTGVTMLANNTFADNDAAQGSAIAVSGADARHLIVNNVIVAKGAQTAFHCSNSGSTSAPVVSASDVFSPQGFAYGGTCLDQTGLRGNLSADPMFVQNAIADVLGDYHLQVASPAIDAGDNAAPAIGPYDLDGGARVVDGNQDGEARIDLGAYEYRNGPPTAIAGADQTVTAGADCSAVVSLDGSASTDPEGESLTWTWSGSFGTVSGPAVSIALPAGTHVITLTVRDARGGSASDTVVVTVRDTTAPVIQSATATPSVLTQRNKHLVPVTVSVSVADACGGSTLCRIVAVTSNEPIDASDWTITGDLALKLRADRENRGNGRIYMITVECVDGSGNTSTTVATVTVPR